MVKMFEGSSIEQQEAPQPQTVEQLQAALNEAKQLVELFRQQRDKMGSVANDLQASLSLTQFKLKQVEEELEKYKNGGWQQRREADAAE